MAIGRRFLEHRVVDVLDVGLARRLEVLGHELGDRGSHGLPVYQAPGGEPNFDVIAQFWRQEPTLSYRENACPVARWGACLRRVPPMEVSYDLPDCRRRMLAAERRASAKPLPRGWLTPMCCTTIMSPWVKNRRPTSIIVSPLGSDFVVKVAVGLARIV